MSRQTLRAPEVFLDATADYVQGAAIGLFEGTRQLRLAHYAPLAGSVRFHVTLDRRS